MIVGLGYGLIVVGFGVAFIQILRRFLHFFQQEEYDNLRFLHWWIRSRSFEKRATGTALALALAGGLVGLWVDRIPEMVAGLSVLLLSFAGWSHRKREAKKPLVMTSRARRIFVLAWVVLMMGWIGGLQCIRVYIPTAFFFASLFLSASLSIQLIPVTLVAANGLLFPFESRIQKTYLREAKEILRRVNPTIIGITGSYGKTSTKHILAHILANHAPTLATPGSVNTLMGITRIIRERLRDEHRYFIVEMGAYKIGSIKTLCELTPPHLAIVTAVGLAHLERFKSVETVAQAKSELPRSLSPDGIAVLNGDDPHCRNMGNHLPTMAFFYGRTENAGPLHCRLLRVETLPQGTHCVLAFDGKEYEIGLPIFGAHQAMNAAAAFLAAVRLGVPAVTALAALRNLPPIAHRLEVQTGAEGITIIDDSYNSNPIGFLNALETLRDLPGERKILVTPGMVELGAKEAEEHARVAAFAAHMCHRICLIRPQRVPTLRSALLQNGFSVDNLSEFDSLRDAQGWLTGQLRRGDVVLYENDLPDLYESPSAFA